MSCRALHFKVHRLRSLDLHQLSAAQARTVRKALEMHVHADAKRLFHDHPGRFELKLEDRLHRRDAQSTLRTLIGWCRYAELFS
jgi:hypothetical protein